MIGQGLNTFPEAARHVDRTGSISRFSNRSSIEFDGTDDYLEATLSSDPFNHAAGTISLWANQDARGGIAYFQAYNSSNHAANKLAITNQGITGTVLDGITGIDGLFFQYTSTLDGTKRAQTCQAMESDAYHGHGHTRKQNSYRTAGGSGWGNDHVAIRTTANLTDGNWQHIVASWDTTETFTPVKATSTSAYVTASELTGAMRIYVNGALKNHGQSTLPASNNTIAATGNMFAMDGATLDRIRIGSSGSGGSDMDGHVSHVGIWNTRLTDAQVTAIYNSGVPTDLRYASGNYLGGAVHGLIGYWTMQENTGTTVYDRSSNNNHLTLNNNAAFSTSVTP